MKKLLFIILSIFIWNVAQAQMSKGITYIYEFEGQDNWMKFNTGMWMGETWISMAISAVPDKWTTLEILKNESTDAYTIVKLPNTEIKMKIVFQEKGIMVSDPEGKDAKFFRLYERYGEKVD